jgi:hypothetical protein
MAVGSESMVGLVRSIVAVGSREREAGAENASDWVAIFDREEAEAVALLLANVASIEMDARVREAQIHAILEISDTHQLRSELLRSLNSLNRENLDPEQLSYLSELGLGPDGGDGVST